MRNGLKQTLSTSGGLELLQIVLEPGERNIFFISIQSIRVRKPLSITSFKRVMMIFNELYV